MSGVIGALNSMTSGGAALRGLEGTLARTPNTAASDTSPTAPGNGLVVDSLTVTGDDGDTLFSAPGLRIGPGEKVRLMGANGCGKSTLCRILAGSEHRHDGNVWVDGHHLPSLLPGEAVPGLEFAAQDDVVAGEPLATNVTLLRDVDDDAVLAALAEVGLTDSRYTDALRDNTVPEWISGLSGGERQRLHVARCLVGQPSILILDEALSEVDTATRTTILRRLVSRQNLTLVIVDHGDLPVPVDRVVEFRAGKVTEGLGPVVVSDPE